MIIQTAPPNHPHFVILQTDHARMAGQFAQAFGNDEFDSLHPKALMEFVVKHHDEGWVETDTAVLRDPTTHLPYHLTQTPLPELLKTAARSPEFNEKHHPFCGLISSMHTYGLYNGRYGLYGSRFVGDISGEHKTAVETMLQAELNRQQRLKNHLANHHATKEWISDAFLFYHYKLLQFFDMLALYFQMKHTDNRQEAHFLHVPMNKKTDVTVTIRPVGPAVYALSPFPFVAEGMTFSYEGRYLRPQPENLTEIFRRTLPEREMITVIAG